MIIGKNSSQYPNISESDNGGRRAHDYWMGRDFHVLIRMNKIVSRSIRSRLRAGDTQRIMMRYFVSCKPSLLS